MNTFISSPIKIMVSSCLLGNNVRYDGTNKRSILICNTFPQFFNLQEICPEVAIGLGTPRRPIKMFYDIDLKHFSLVDDLNVSQHYSDAMLSFTKQIVTGLHSYCAVIVKERSPSCGLRDTPRYGNKGEIISYGAGFFTERLIQSNDWMPIITEFGLDDLKQRDNFLERVFIKHLWNFHCKNKKQQQIFNTKIQHQLDVRQNTVSFDDSFFNDTRGFLDQRYLSAIMTILKFPVTIDMHVKFLTNILRHHNIESNTIAEKIVQFWKREISLWSVIQQFQELFSNKNININSNYFYPEQREVESRDYYFEHK